MANIDFNEIQDTKVPGVYCEIDNSLANVGLPGKPAVGLLIGQSLGGLLQPETISGVITDPDQAISLVGAGSELHRMCIAWLKQNRNTKLYLIPVAQTEGVAAVYNLKITAENVKAGMLNLMIAGYDVRLTINDEDSAAEIVTALIAKINANKLIPVIAAAVENKPEEISLTAKHKGENGNNIDIRLNYFEGQETAIGVKVEISEGTRGTGNASLENVIATLGDGYYTDIVSSYSDSANLRLLKAELNRRFNAHVNNESVVYYTIKGTLNAMLTAIDSINHQCISPIMDYKSPNMPEVRASSFGSIAAIEFQKDPARQISTLVLKDDLPASESLTSEERNMLLNAGVSTLVTNASGETAIEREVTSYRLNNFGAVDESYFDLPTLKTVIYLRYSYIHRMKSKFGRHKLAGDDYEVEPGQAIVTPTILAAELLALAEDWQSAGLVEDISAFKDSIISIRNSDDPNRVDQLFQPNIINNLRVLAGKLQFKL